MPPPAADHPLMFQSTSYARPEPGTHLIVLGAVHGNETCGTQAIRRLIGEFDTGELTLARGALTLVPVANPMAYREGRRHGDRNLNRKLGPTDTPTEFEDHVANWLCPLLARHEVLLDLHSVQAGGAPFVMVGPQDNAGPLEPFGQAARELEWAGAVSASGAPSTAGSRPTRAASNSAARPRRAARSRAARSISIRATASAPPSTCARRAVVR